MDRNNHLSSTEPPKPDERAPLLAVRDLTVVEGGHTILDVPSLEVCDGETLAIIGPNGAGKSTLLHVLAGLRAPDSGELHFRGQRIQEMGTLAYRRRLAVVMQDPLLLDTTVGGNVALGLRFRGTGADERERRVDVWLRRLHIDHLRERSSRSLSGGEAQRVSLARALATEPALLFLDEPFAALDAPSRQSLLDTLFAILRETGQTTILVTHDRDEALMLGDRVAVMLGGGIRQIGTPDVVFSQPADEQVATFVGVENVLPADIRGNTDGLADVRLGGETIQVATNQTCRRVWVALRPEDIVLWPSQRELPRSSARNVLRGEVQRVVAVGTTVRVVVSCAGFDLVVLVTRRSADEFRLQPGTRVLATFKATAAHLLERT